ncbi:hypothetical protein [Tahibacter amnicola]|uniref:Uncharacterized protein n=1 Tax=Tahibacter amnicola TaxID=2976241 RepID=A0ABY6BP66_9GAMM|nr:hypothetical protein [Tahibacter amnicola]UXI70195.1 hypothetical protein N4264_11350 [Tahibacter amnicola]
MFTMQKVLATLILAVCSAATANAAPVLTEGMQAGKAVHDAAQAALRSFGAEVGRGNGLPPNFPLAVADISDVNRATIGVGYEELHADPHAIMAGQSLQKSARASSMWRFTVMVDDRAVGMITMVNDKGQWRVRSIGAAALANEVNAVAQSAGKDAQLRVIRVLQATSDFVEVSSAAQKSRLVPLASARKTLGLSQALVAPNTSAVEEAEFAQSLRDTIARNLAQ